MCANHEKNLILYDRIEAEEELAERVQDIITGGLVETVFAEFPHHAFNQTDPVRMCEKFFDDAVPLSQFPLLLNAYAARYHAEKNNVWIGQILGYCADKTLQFQIEETWHRRTIN